MNGYHIITVTVQCLQDGHFVLVVSRHILDYPVILDSVRLSYAQAGCDPIRRTEDFLVFCFPLTQCGTTVQVTGGRLIYENQLVSGIILNGPDGSITRDSTFILHTCCVYNATDFLPVQAEVILPPTPAPVSQMGPLRLELRIATDASYRTYYSDGDHPVVKVLGDPVHVEVHVLQRIDPFLVLVLHECWASPSANPLEQLQWPILVVGHPFNTGTMSSSGQENPLCTYDQATCSQARCCYDDSDISTPCYYGNTVTVQCLRDGHFILVVSRDMLNFPVVLDSVKLSYAQAGCDPVRRTEAFLIFHFPLTQCGTTVQVIGDKLIYENQLVSGIDIQNGPDGSITRDSTFMLHARCIYNATDFLPVQAEVILPPTPAPVSQMGPLRLELRIATDASYRTYYSDGDHPVVKVLGDPVHVEVHVLQRIDPFLVLVLHECWASPSTNPLEQLQWPILVDGCPFEGDNYRTQLVPLGPASSELPFPAHYQRFIISTFAFVDSGSKLVLSQLVRKCTHQ
ncbi:zona pellucida sperm-binding protein 1 [Eublepharis macularius]|uniref:Zona pellucida sperm-binding protein 1 n=1 Tax=Eublepharis macularius TaxID=481883 RepID=A0AA97IYI9_EUBMA|nr:zona pellucida sperm-binding protein 1 [Eublepharis macularius]